MNAPRPMSDEERAIRHRLKTDFPHYAERCLRLRTKSGLIKPFDLNKAQMVLHRAIEKQRAETGLVRVIVLKGRQLGCSTYVSGRFYWRTTHTFGIRAFILTHEQQATDNLFEMTRRFHDHCPNVVKPTAAMESAKGLLFDRLDSGYAVGTAGTKAVGRSRTLQLFHGSEVAFWPNAKDHMAGIMQAIPNEPGTEVILESTANGQGNIFHETWTKAEKGDNEFIPVFMPWFWGREYQLPIPDADFKLEPDEVEYMEQHELTVEQMVWRRAKISELGADLFKQEYPATAVEAFQSIGVVSFIPSDIVMRARKNRAEIEPTGPKLLGVDPAIKRDRFSLIRRQGRVAYGLESHRNWNTMAMAGYIAKIIDDEEIDKVFIDSLGLGVGVCDRLDELGYRDRLIRVEYGEKANRQDKYANKRAECWGELKEWLDSPHVKIPDVDSLERDLTGPQYRYNSHSQLLLEKKEDMMKPPRNLPSPDEGDCLANTFAEPVKLDRPPTGRPRPGSSRPEGWLRN